MTLHPRWLLGLLSCLPAAGCCSIAQGMTALFCGASKEPWATVSYRTPKEALRTFQEAIGREDLDVFYKSLSADFKRRLQGRIRILSALHSDRDDTWRRRRSRSKRALAYNRAARRIRR